MTDRKAFADQMRAIADFIENNEDVPIPNMFNFFPVSAWHSLTKSDLATIAQAAARAGLNVEKQYMGNDFSLKIGSGEGFKFQAIVSRDTVCKRVDTGRTESYKDYPDDVELVEKERPVYEWVCDEPLLGGG